MQIEKARRHRVMMIGPYPRTPDQINGGVAAAQMYLSEALSRRDDVELIGVRIARDDSDVCESARFNWVIEDLPLGRLSLTTLYEKQQRKLAELVDRYKPDVLHAQGADIAGYLAVRSSVPSVVTIHGLLAECARLQSNWLARWRAVLAAAVTERGTVMRASDLIAISPYVSAHYSNQIRGQVHEVPNAVAARYFELTRDPRLGRFLYAGRIANGKGLVELIEAFAQSRSENWSLILAGATPDPTYEKSLRERVRALGVSGCVHFRGLLAESALLDEFSQAQSLVLPSFQETAPMVIQQAMAAGIAVVASRVGGIPFQIEHETTGLLHEPGDVRMLGEHLRSIATHPEQANALGAAARSRAESRYRASAVADATLEIYRTIIWRQGRKTA